MTQTKNIYTFDDLLEVLAEQAVGTETMKNIEQFCQRRDEHTKYLLRRLEQAERIVGSYQLDEHMMYD
jgi:dTDP-4-amino-4,6-dideoxygalactose transaminase